MQKFILFLHHPIYAIAATLTAFLLFAGLGSYYSKSIARRRTAQPSVMLAVSGIALFSLGYLYLLPPLFNICMAFSLMAKITVTMLLIAPLAFFMGMPFPLALAGLAQHADAYIPWAWGINGCASVISAVLATLLAIHFGFTTVISLAVLLYILVVFVFPAPLQRS